MKDYRPRYVCQRCEHTFVLESPEPVACTKCGHAYVFWLNYDEWRQRWHQFYPSKRPY